MSSRAGTIVACICLFAGAAFFHLRALDLLSSNHEHYRQNQLPNPEALKLVSCGFETLMADGYWLLFVQHVGANKSDKIDADLDRQYIDLITTLDPHFGAAYYFAAFVIGGEEHRPDIASKILDKGIFYNPDNWYLCFIAGINQFLYAHQPLQAAHYYELASRCPNAPRWLAHQVVILRAAIPHFVKEINVWDSIYHNASDSKSKDEARRQLLALWSYVRDRSSDKVFRQRAEEQLRRLKVDSR